MLHAISLTGEIRGEVRAKAMQVRDFWKEFRTFAFKGNMIDLAVAVVVGNAFGAAVNALVKNIIMPIISYPVGLAGKDGQLESYKQWHIGQVEIGPFLAELFHFLIVALAMFLVVVKLFGSMQRLISRDDGTPATKECPYCLSMIPHKAVKCSHCTADLVTSPDGKPKQEAGAGSS
jgi:large conductance mechanosensitive channel